MVAALRLVVGVVILDELRRVLRQRVDDTAGFRVRAVPVINRALVVQRFLCRIAVFFVVIRIEIAIRRDAVHVVHRRRDRGLDARVHHRVVDGDAAPAADADDADGVRIHVRAVREVIDGRGEIFRVDVKRSDIADTPAALARERRVERDRQEAALRHRLRVKAGRLLLHRAERAGNRDGCELRVFRRILRLVDIRRERDAVAVVERDFFMRDLLALREHFIPFVCHRELLLPI